jgi:hypothetical protein
MQIASLTAFALAAGLAGCGSSAPASRGPSPYAGPDVAANCLSYEATVEACRPTCAECEGEAPGNTCNLCAEACATRVTCQQCNAGEGCE